MSNELPELVVCAANRHEGVVYCGARHFDKIIWEQMRATEHPSVPGKCFALSEQGFITNRGRFVTRSEAFIIAKENDQIIRICGNPESTELFSENLY